MLVDSPVRKVTEDGEVLLLPLGHKEKIATLLLAAEEVSRDALTTLDGMSVVDREAEYSEVYVDVVTLLDKMGVER